MGIDIPVTLFVELAWSVLWIISYQPLPMYLKYINIFRWQLSGGGLFRKKSVLHKTPKYGLTCINFRSFSVIHLVDPSTRPTLRIFSIPKNNTVDCFIDVCGWVSPRLMQKREALSCFEFFNKNPWISHSVSWGGACVKCMKQLMAGGFLSDT